MEGAEASADTRLGASIDCNSLGGRTGWDGGTDAFPPQGGLALSAACSGSFGLFGAFGHAAKPMSGNCCARSFFTSSIDPPMSAAFRDSLRSGSLPAAAPPTSEDAAAGTMLLGAGHAGAASAVDGAAAHALGGTDASGKCSRATGAHKDGSPGKVACESRISANWD